MGKRMTGVPVSSLKLFEICCQELVVHGTLHWEL
jgi:hypothetical protein